MVRCLTAQKQRQRAECRAVMDRIEAMHDRMRERELESAKRDAEHAVQMARAQVAWRLAYSPWYIGF